MDKTSYLLQSSRDQVGSRAIFADDPVSKLTTGTDLIRRILFNEGFVHFRKKWSIRGITKPFCTG